MKPSNFLLAYQVDPVAVYEYPEFLESITRRKSDRPSEIAWPKPVAPYDSDPSKAADKCFDRDTGDKVPAGALKTCAQALAQYHLRPERKFLNGDYMERGITKRRHVRPSAIRQIGKESNRWEEQFYLGGDESAEINHGIAPQDESAMLDRLRCRWSP